MYLITELQLKLSFDVKFSLRDFVFKIVFLASAKCGVYSHP